MSYDVKELTRRGGASVTVCWKEPQDPVEDKADAANRSDPLSRDRRLEQCKEKWEAFPKEAVEK